MLSMGRKRGLLLVWLVVFLLLAVPLYGQSILTQAVSGTGFIVSSDGYILTNKHVVNGATQISVTIGGKEYEASVVNSLSDNDIALLKIDAHGLPTVMLGDSDKVGIGDTVYAIGCPAGVCGTITEGRVANLGITSKTDEGTTLHNLIMSDLTTTHGSSGGPLLNDRGEVIGITTAGIVVQGETTGFGVSIPINQAITLLRQVPGFSTSQMGRAGTVLSLGEIRRSIGPGTAFVQAEVQRALTDLLPREALGRSLARVTGIPIYTYDFMGNLQRGPFSKDTALLWLYLQRKHVKMEEMGEAINKAETSDSMQTIIIDIFNCASPAEALRALTYLRTPMNWDLYEPQPDFPPLSTPIFPPSRAGLFPDAMGIFDSLLPLRTTTMVEYGPVNILLSTSDETDGVVVNTVIYYLYYPDSCTGSTNGASCSPSDAPPTFRPCLGLWGFRSFVIGNLAFLIAYRSAIAGPELPEESCVNMAIQGSNWEWMPNCYRWDKESDSFIFSEEYGTKHLLSFNIHPFLDSFDQLLRALFYDLASQ